MQTFPSLLELSADAVIRHCPEQVGVVPHDLMPLLGERAVKCNYRNSAIDEEIHSLSSTIVETMTRKQIENTTKALDAGRPFVGLPINVAGRQYMGINRRVLSLELLLHDWPTPVFATYEEWKRRHGHVRRGEHGVSICITIPPKLKKNEEPPAWVHYKYRRATVFNLAQVEFDKDAHLVHVPEDVGKTLQTTTRFDGHAFGERVKQTDKQWTPDEAFSMLEDLVVAEIAATDKRMKTEAGNKLQCLRMFSTKTLAMQSLCTYLGVYESEKLRRMSTAFRNCWGTYRTLFEKTCTLANKVSDQLLTKFGL